MKVPREGNEEESYTTYIVKGGDSLYSIAMKYNTTVETIKQANGLSSNLLSIGQILKIPTKNISINYKEYEVKPGDSLYSIAQLFNTTVDAIMKTNNLQTNFKDTNRRLYNNHRERVFWRRICRTKI